MKVLELFKGTGSVGKCISILHPDWEITSLDILNKYKPTICCDIMDWDYKVYEPKHFDIIWASPECKVYSTLQQSLNIGRWGKTRDEQKANLEKKRRENDKYVLRVLDIIDYLKPAKWFIENPWASNMKTIPQLAALDSYRFDYCRFGFDYQKPTRIWSNIKFEDMKCNCFPKPKPKEEKPKRGHKLCIGIDKASKVCNYQGELIKANTKIPAYQIPEKLVEHLVEDKPKHKKRIGMWNKSNPSSLNNLDERYSIPEQLVEHLIPS